jgi:hypothetical protein
MHTRSPSRKTAPIIRHLLSGFLALACLQSAHAGVADLRSREDIATGSVGLTGPGGGAVIGGAVWVADARLGFVRMEPVDSANPAGMLRPSAQSIPVTVGGQVCTDGGQHVYVMDASNKTGGVVRVDLDAAGSAITGYYRFGKNLGITGSRPTACAVGPDGNLYIGFRDNGDIRRITNPTASTPVQAMSNVGKVADKVRGLGFIGPDLYVGTKKGPAVIPNAAGCSNCSGEFALWAFSEPALGMATDGVRRRLSPASSGVYGVSQGPGFGCLCGFTGLGRTPEKPGPTSDNLERMVFFSGRTALIFIDPATDTLWMADDPSDAVTPGKARLWSMPLDEAQP